MEQTSFFFKTRFNLNNTDSSEVSKCIGIDLPLGGGGLKPFREQHINQAGGMKKNSTDKANVEDMTNLH